MELESNLSKVLEIFFKYPTTSLHIRKIARLVNLSPAAVSKLLKKLEEKELITKTKKEVTVEYKANRDDNKRFKHLKRIYNLKSIYESGLVDYLSEKYGFNSTIVLFGSYMQGDDWEKSDIDIAILTKRKVHLELDKYEKKLGREINIIETTKEISDKNFLNNLANGIVLGGYLEIL